MGVYSMGLEDILLGVVFEFIDGKTNGKLSSMAGNVNNSNSNKRDAVIRLSNSMEKYSDDELRNIWETGSGDKKYAAAYLLKQRGY